MRPLSTDGAILSLVLFRPRCAQQNVERDLEGHPYVLGNVVKKLIQANITQQSPQGVPLEQMFNLLLCTSLV